MELDTQLDQPNNDPKKQSALREFISTSSMFLVAIATVIFINLFIIQPYQVEGTSMFPTLNDNDRLIVLKLPKSFSSLNGVDYIPNRGDIVIFHKPGDYETQLIKRVVGVPGDKVIVKDGAIKVFNLNSPDGIDPDKEAGLTPAFTEGDVNVSVDVGEIFVVGDNRNPGASLDSRFSLGNVPLDNVVGRLGLRIFPFSDFEAY